VHVRPLPEGGRPEDFDNVVGDFELESALSADTVAANESVTFTLAVTGRGNVGFVPVPELEVGPDVELYEPQVKEEHSVRADNVQGSKVFTWLMIPRRPGRQRIPALELPYFDPEAGRYRIARAKEQTLVVRGTAGWAGEEAPADVAWGDVETLATDIRWILASTRGLSRQGPPLRARTGYWLAWLAPLFIVAGAFGLRRQLAARAGREGQIRSRKAARRAREALKQAREALGGGDVEVGYEALARGLTGYVADRIGVPAAQLDRARIQRELSQRPISEASRSELAAILDLCDTARFTPEGGDPEALRKLIERSGRWIDSVDRPLGAKERL
jgi:hypothetical protein